ncbi:HEAT repeat domain-containing protein [Actinoplanes regularis]|uniref:HEAT repeat-containing protein n=1 Tax=Actinoplanes regularis TaxID=52697 RepID=A0A239JWP4_9ACTN|nr:HEAT repeat domain-containing protein [Actinoplanes regularis]GIE92254.1 hypothetical protein Are01nite_87340 [Actinoplanes regularis]SNT10099.1 HEAT repeat-containing protein [Actinoplanes regularis]
MTSAQSRTDTTRLLAALNAGNSSARLRAALAIGTHAGPEAVDLLVTRSGIEPDFFVRDMLTWALTRLPPESTVPRLVAALRSERAQDRGQALHTLSKIGDRSAWPAIMPVLLRDPDDEVARTAWRTATVLVADEEKESLAAELARQFGRGDREVRLSLSRAFVALGDMIEPVLQTALTDSDPEVRAHANATRRLLHDPDAGFDLSVAVATRIVALGPEQPVSGEDSPTC